MTLVAELRPLRLLSDILSLRKDLPDCPSSDASSTWRTTAPAEVISAGSELWVVRVGDEESIGLWEPSGSMVMELAVAGGTAAAAVPVEGGVTTEVEAEAADGVVADGPLRV